MAGCEPAWRADPAARFVDRWRPGRQPERHRGRRPAGHLARGVHRSRALLRRNHSAGGRAVDVGAAGQDHRRTGGAGRRVPRACACRRAVPARAAGHPRQAHRDRATRSSTDQPEHELDLGLEAYGTPEELLADLDVVDGSLRANGSAVLADDRLARLREAVARLRVSLIRPGPAAELRCARGGRRGALGVGRCAP